jgi:hypothetical protein
MSFDWATALVGVLIVVAILWMRAAVVSLNKDMRAILDGQAEVRKRLDALERCGMDAEKG